MSNNRIMAEKVILKWVDKIDPSGNNGKLYQQRFKQMSNKQFHDYMELIRTGQDFLSMVVDNLNGSAVTIDNNLKVGKEIGHEFFQRVWTTDPITGTCYLTNRKYLLMHLPVKRMIQTLLNKMSIPEDNAHRDELTDQPSGVSQSSRISFPELLVLVAQDQSSGIVELMKVRGGDTEAMNVIDRSIHETGSASLAQVMSTNNRVKSTETLSTLFKAMHLDNNI